MRCVCVRMCVYVYVCVCVCVQAVGAGAVFSTFVGVSAFMGVWVTLKPLSGFVETKGYP
jgi:hypothetical protein